MKILQVVPSLNSGGAERMVVNISNELKKRGHQVIIALLQNEENHFEKDCQQLQIAKTPVDITLSLIRANKVNVTTLESLIIKERPDIIHSHLYQAEFAVGLCKFSHSIKWFSHIHGFAVEYSRPRKIKARLSLAYERNQFNHKQIHFISVSKGITSFLKRKFKSKYTIIELPNAIDISQFKANFKPINHEQLELITIGNLNQNKNHIFLIEALNEFKKINPIKTVLNIVGKGPEEERIKKLANNYNIKVNLLGKQHHVARFLSEADVYLHAAKKEAFGLTILEAMATGIPAIAINAGGNSDIIKNGINGFLIPEHSPFEFANRLNQLVVNPEKYVAACKEARITAEKYTLENYMDNLIEIYEST